MQRVLCFLVLVALLCHTFVLGDDDLKVFILPHSHIDQGWLRTVGEYRDETLGILRSVIESMAAASHRKYVWGDVLYFRDWYEGQSAEIQQRVREYINNGRFELVGGGWIQNDEACPSTQAIINQMTVGHEYLLNRFNVRPKVAWQIDPFGHEGRIPKLYAEMGFDAIVINRVHHKIKAQMKSEKSLEFIWKPKSSAVPTTTYKNESDGLFTHVLHTHYSAPQDFDFENPGVRPVDATNVRDRARQFVEEMRRRAAHYRTNHILVPFGDDFKFKDANRQFSNMDNLIEHINKEMSGIKVQYATATEYFESLYQYQQENEIDFPIVQQDFVPYADNEDSYWTGYYTSLPNLKKRAREAEAALQNAENAFILAKLYKSKRGDNLEWQSLFSRLQTAREDTALVNHHDGITGTCRSHVYQDYMSRLANSISASKSLERELLTVMLSGDEAIAVSDPNSILESDTDIIIHNSEGHPRYDLVSIKSHSANARIIDLTTGAEVPSMKIANLLTTDQRLAQTGAEYNFYWVHFFVSVKALSVKKYQIKFDGTDQAATSFLYCSACPPNIRDGLPRPLRLQGVEVSNEFYTLRFGENGFIDSIVDKKSDKDHHFGPQFMEYKTHRSGSYIFRPEGAGPEQISADSVLAIFVTEGTLLTEVIVTTTRFTMTYRLYEEWIDSHFDIHPLPADTELVTKFYANINTQSKLIVYDGINFVKRVVNDKAPHAGHYFPSTAGAIITDKKSQLTVLTAQTMGVTKVENAIQFMIHRRLQQDDGRGMAQANNDESSLRGVRFLLSYQDTKQSTRFVHLARSSIDINRPISVSTMAVAKTVELVEPVSNLDEDLEIISFQSRELYSDDVVLRIRNMNPSKAQVYHPGRTFHGELESIRGKSLSLAFDVPNNARNIHPYRMQFRTAGTVSFDFTLVSATVGKDGANQNSDEEGVFLSDEALAEAKKNQGRQLKGMEDWVYKFEPFEMKTFLLDLKMEDLKQLGAPIVDAQQQKPKSVVKLTKPPVKQKPPVIEVHGHPKTGDADSEHHDEKEFIDVDAVLQNDPQVQKDQRQPLHPNSLLQDEEYHLWGSYTFVLLLSVVGFCALTYCFRKGSKKLFAKFLRTSTASPITPKEAPILPYEVVSDTNKEH